MHVGFPAASATEQGGSQRIHESFSGNFELIRITIQAFLHLYHLDFSSFCRRPRRLGGGKGGEGREPREPKDPNKRMKAGLAPTAVPGALGDR